MAMSSYSTSSRLKPVHFSERGKTRAEAQKKVRRITIGDAEMVVAWLNATKGTSAHRRVLRMHKELADLGVRLLDLKAKAKSHDEHLIFWSQFDTFRKDHNALNRRLARYSLVPALAYVVDSGFWHFSSIPKRVTGPVVKIPIDTPMQGIPGLLRVNEASVVSSLARLATKGELRKVRLCEQCGQKWLVSQREIDRFCCGACRKEFHSTSDEGRRRHREAQRKYRENLPRLMTWR